MLPLLSTTGQLLEKRINSNLNTWIRAPGTLFGSAFLYQALLRGNHPGVPWFPLALQLLLPPFNAMYYSKQAVANFAVHHMLDYFGKKGKGLADKLGERTSVTTGERVLQWHPAYAVPQRGS